MLTSIRTVLEQKTQPSGNNNLVGANKEQQEEVTQKQQHLAQWSSLLKLGSSSVLDLSSSSSWSFADSVARYIPHVSSLRCIILKVPSTVQSNCSKC